MGIYIAKTKKVAEYASAEEEGNFLEDEVYGVDEESYYRVSSVKVAGMGEIVLGCPF